MCTVISKPESQSETTEELYLCTCFYPPLIIEMVLPFGELLNL